MDIPVSQRTRSFGRSAGEQLPFVLRLPVCRRPKEERDGTTRLDPHYNLDVRREGVYLVYTIGFLPEPLPSGWRET